MNQTNTYICDQLPTKHQVANWRTSEKKEMAFITISCQTIPAKLKQSFDNEPAAIRYI